MNYSFFIASLYVIFNTLCLVAYIPQFLSLLKSSSARKTIAMLMWSTWALGAFIELLYAHDLKNIPWTIMSLGHLVACLVIIGFGVYEKIITRERALKPAHKPRFSATS